MAKYVVEHRSGGMIRCLPEEIFRKELIDISRVGALYCKDLDLETGIVHDSGKYWKEVHEEENGCERTRG